MTQLKSDAKLPYFPLSSVFRSTMEREGRTVTAYTSGQEFKAFMRRNNDGNSAEDKITLFYDITAPVIAGSIIVFGRKMYLLINRETEENDCYYKSSAIALNGEIYLNDGTLQTIPCYAYDIKDGLADKNYVISVISGNMEFITEDNSLSRMLSINKTFNSFGRTWNINNIYYKDGILHTIAEVCSNENPTELLDIVIDGCDKFYNVGDKAILTATMYRNYEIQNGTILWTTSNSDVATVNSLGMVSFLSEGNVTFTARWVDKNYEKTTEQITVYSQGISLPDDDYNVKFTGNTSLKIGYARTYTIAITKNNIDVTNSCSYTINTICPYEISKTSTDNKIKLLVNDDNAIGSTITLQVLINNIVYGELKIQIVDIY